jgi:hypothetical protein
VYGKILEAARDGKSLGKDNLNSQLHKYAGELFHGRLLLFFNTIFMMGETPEEWKNSIVIPIHMKGGKQKVENYSWKIIIYLMSFIKYNKVFDE